MNSIDLIIEERNKQRLHRFDDSKYNENSLEYTTTHLTDIAAYICANEDDRCIMESNYYAQKLGEKYINRYDRRHQLVIAAALIVAELDRTEKDHR